MDFRFQQFLLFVYLFYPNNMVFVTDLGLLVKWVEQFLRVFRETMTRKKVYKSWKIFELDKTEINKNSFVFQKMRKVLNVNIFPLFFGSMYAYVYFPWQCLPHDLQS